MLAVAHDEAHALALAQHDEQGGALLLAQVQRLQIVLHQPCACKRIQYCCEVLSVFTVSCFMCKLGSPELPLPAVVQWRPILYITW